MKKITWVITLLFLIIMGCEKEIIRESEIIREMIDSSSNKDISAIAVISTWYYGYNNTRYWSDADVLVYGYQIVPEITIDSIAPNNPFFSDFDYNNIVFELGRMCDLKIKIGENEVTASQKMPDTCEVSEPVNGGTLNSDNQLVRWSNAHCDHYELYVYWHYHNAQNYHYADDTVITITDDTSYILQNYLPDMQPGYTWWGGYLGVTAINGPQFKPNTPGNIQGDGGGFFWTNYYSYGTWFNLGTSSSSDKINNNSCNVSVDIEKLRATKVLNKIYSQADKTLLDENLFISN